MTIAEMFIEQGRAEVRQEMEQEIQKIRQEAQQKLQAQERQNLLSSIELGLELKFGQEGLRLFNEVQQIQEMSQLIIIRTALKFVSDLGELHFKGPLLPAISHIFVQPESLRGSYLHKPPHGVAFLIGIALKHSYQVCVAASL